MLACLHCTCSDQTNQRMAEKCRRSGEMRKMNSCISLDWFVISFIFRVLAVRFGCTVLFFPFSLLIYVASLSRKKKRCDVGFNTSRRQQQQVTSTNTPLLRTGPVDYLVLACDNVSSLVWSTMNTILHLTTFTSY